MAKESYILSSSTSEALEALMTIRNSDTSATTKSAATRTNNDRNETNGTIPSEQQGDGIVPIDSATKPCSLGIKVASPISPYKELVPPVALLIKPVPVPVSNGSCSGTIDIQPAPPVPQLAYNFPIIAAMTACPLPPSSYTTDFHLNPNINSTIQSYSSVSTAVPTPPTSAPKCVRTEEIQRALQSAPQRGKKRNNLNQDERKELTRNRNRLHAKTTRQRKRARYDELVQIERIYQKMVNETALADVRKKSVLDLQSLFTGLMNFQESVQNCVDGEIIEMKAVYEVKVRDMFSSKSTITILSPSSKKQSFECQEFQDGIRKIGSDFQDTITNDICFDFVIPESTDGIALSNVRTAFCTYEIIGCIKGSPENATCPVSSGILQVRFGEETKQITSLVMSIASSTSLEHALEGREGKPSIVA